MLMFTTYAPKYIRFQACEGSVTELISSSELSIHLSTMVCSLQAAAVRTHFVGPDYVPQKNIDPVTYSENKQLVALEKNLDVCVLQARVDDVDDTSSVPRNENTSVAASSQDKERPWQTVKGKKKGDFCGRFGDIDKDEFGDRIEQEKLRIQQELDGDFVDFPMVDMDDEFGPHWARKDKLCKSNGFNGSDAAHFNLNHVRFSYETYKEILDGIKAKRKLKSSDFKKAFAKVTGDNPMAGYGKLVGNFEDQYLRENGQRDLVDVLYEEPGEDLPPPPDLDFDTMFENISVESRFGDTTVSEELRIDKRLLNAEYFRELDVPPIFMGSVLRNGEADYHSVYFEGKNAMGQVGKWATILIVRPTRRSTQDARFRSECEEYVERYASEHTFFVELPNRAEVPYLKGLANTKGYSAGDSKYYCWRMAQWLHDRWSADLAPVAKAAYNQTKRRCVIGDDQILPWVHQVPKFNDRARMQKAKGESTEEFASRKAQVEEERLARLANNDKVIIARADKDYPRNDQYKFRSTIRDLEGESMMAPGNNRFPITHAAVFMYMNRISDIMGAGIVCSNNGDPILWNIPLKEKQEAMCCWLINLNLIEPALFNSTGKPYLQSAINPAFQAAEDLMMFRVARDRGVRVVTCSTVRWRKAPSAKNSTAGRSDTSKEIPPPFRPIIKYHDMLRTVKRFKPAFPPVFRRSSWPAFPRGFSIDVNCWPFDKIGWVGQTKKVKSKDKFYAHEFWIQRGNFIASCAPGAEMELYWGDYGLEKENKESELQFLSGGYGARHRFNIVVLKMLDAIERDALEEYDGVDDITENLRRMAVSVPATKAKKRKPRRQKKRVAAADDSDSDDDEEEYMGGGESKRTVNVTGNDLERGYAYEDAAGDRLYYFSSQDELKFYGTDTGRIDWYSKGENQHDKDEDTGAWFESKEQYNDAQGMNGKQELKELGHFYVTTKDNMQLVDVADKTDTSVSLLVKLNPHIPGIRKTRGRTTFFQGQCIIYKNTFDV